MNIIDFIGSAGVLVALVFIAAIGVLWFVFPWLLFRRMDRMQRTLEDIAAAQAKASKVKAPAGSITGF